MADSSIVDALRATDLFGSLGSRALGKVADRCRVISHEAGKEVATQGDEGVGLHLITEGTAAVNVHGTARPSLRAGDYFGEVSLIDGKPRSATVVAETPLTTISLVSWAFQPVLDEEPEVAKALLQVLCRRLRTAEGAGR